MRFAANIIPAVAVALGLALGACDSVDDDRIPPLPVTIRLSNTGLWNTYGVTGFGQYRYFIRQLREPSDYPYTEQTYTGFGGVLLIGGMDPFTADTQVPLAYDLACPVEGKSDIRVFIDGERFDAVCPVCGSHYDVVMAGGAPVSGPAAEKKYGMKRYACIPTSNGGYDIVSR